MTTLLYALTYRIADQRAIIISIVNCTQALILAAHHPDLRLALVTTVWGNQTLANTTENALRVLQVAGMDRKELPS
jgi:hypothetical protein